MVRNISALSTIRVIRFLCWTFQWLLPLSLSQPPKDSAPIGDEPPKNTCTQNPAFIPLRNIAQTHSFPGDFSHTITCVCQIPMSLLPKPNHWLQAEIYVEFIVHKICTPQCDRAKVYVAMQSISNTRTCTYAEGPSTCMANSCPTVSHSHWHVTDVSRM